MLFVDLSLTQQSGLSQFAVHWDTGFESWIFSFYKKVRLQNSKENSVLQQQA